MTKQFKVLVNTGKPENNKALEVQQGVGDRGQPIRIKAQAGAKFQLQELSSNKNVAPDYVKVKRVGKDLHIVFENDTQASVIIEDYYREMPAGYNGVIGQAENGSFYEYIPEDPKASGLVPNLADGGEAVNSALGGAEVQPAGAAVALLALNPLLPALGLAGALAAAGGGGGGTTTTVTTSGVLAPASDTGVTGDNKTRDNTPDFQGTATPGAAVSVVINGKTYTATADASGKYAFNVPDALPEGTYTPEITVTPAGGSPAKSNGTPFTIDTTTNVAITIAGTANSISPISGTAEAGDTVVVKDANGNVIGTAIANASGQWNLTPSSAVPAGTITATATDASGNTAIANGSNSSPVIPNGGNALTLTIDTDANNDGFVNYTEIGNTSGTPNTTLTVSAAFDKSKVAVGDVVTITETATGGVVKTITLDATMIAAGKVTTTFASPGDANTFTVKATLTNAAGNTTPVANDSARLDLSNLNPVSPSTKQAAVIEITTDANNDGVLNIAEINGGTNATATVKVSLPTDAKAGDTLLITGTGNNAQTITLSTAQISAGNVTTTFTLPANGSKLDVTAVVSDTAGNVSISATDSATVNTTPVGAPVVTISIDTDNDGFINKDELGSSSTVAVSTALPSSAVAGDTIKVTDGTTVKTRVLTAADITAKAVTDTFTAPANGASINVSATLTTAASGNVSNPGTDSAKIDTSSFTDPGDPTKSGLKVNIDTDANNDAGINAAELTNTNQLIKATITLPTAAAVGDTVTVNASGNAQRVFTLSQADITAGKIVITDYNSTGNNTTFTVSASIKDQALNASPSPDASDSATIVTTISGAPVVTITEDTNNDGTVNFTELVGGVDVLVQLPSIAKAGDTLTVNLNGTTQSIVLSAAQVSEGSLPFAITAPASGTTVTVTATLTDVFGNVSPQGSDTADINTTLPSNVTVGLAVVISTDNNPNDNFVNIAELGSATTFTSRITVNSYAVVGDKVVVSASNGSSALPPITRVLSAADIANGFDVAFNAPADGVKQTVTANYVNAVGNAAIDAQPSDFSTRDTTAPSTTSLTVNNVTADDVINISEAGIAKTTVTGKVTGEFVTGDIVTLTINGMLYTAAVNASGVYSASVTTTDLTSDSDKTVDASLLAHDSSGNSTTVKAFNAYTIDASAPTVAVSMSPTNMIINQTSTVTFQFSEAVSGFDINDVSLSPTNGNLTNFTKISPTKWTATYTPPVNSSGTTANNHIKVTNLSYTDLAGNAGSLGNADYSFDTTLVNNAGYGLGSGGSNLPNWNLKIDFNSTLNGAVINIYNNGSVWQQFTVDGSTNNYNWAMGPSQFGNYSATITYGGNTATMKGMISASSSEVKQYSSPLALDLNGDGVQTISLSEGVHFDMQATGTLQRTGWVNRQDGLLVLDLNKNGAIDNGSELFGDHTLLPNGKYAQDGWQALTRYDENGDRKIDATDAIYNQLQVWTDTSVDGVSDPSELHSLKDLHIASINLHADYSKAVQQNGNALQGLSSYESTDGTTHQMADAWFQVAPSAMVLDLSKINDVDKTSNINMAGNNLADSVKLTLNDVLSIPTTNGIHQLVLTGDANDHADVGLSDWVNHGSNIVQNGHVYSVYDAANGSAAQLLINQTMLNAQHVI